MRSSTRALGVILIGTTLIATSCGISSSDQEKSAENTQDATTLTPEHALASKAAFALDAAYTADYRLVPKSEKFGTEESKAFVMRTHSNIRIDIEKHGSDSQKPHTLTILGDSEMTHQCITLPESSGCIPSSSPGAPLGGDPEIHHPFTDWLNHLVSRHAALSVEEAYPPNDSPLAEVPGTCYSVERVTASVKPPVHVGIYCLDDDGIITGLSLGFGTLALVRHGPPPESVALPTAAGDTLPDIAVPSPSPSPTPSG